MSEYPVKHFDLPVLVPIHTDISDEFGVAVAQLTTANCPGMTLDPAVSELAGDDSLAFHGYNAIVGRVRYIEPSDEDREYAEGLKGKGITSSIITWPSL